MKKNSRWFIYTLVTLSLAACTKTNQTGSETASTVPDDITVSSMILCDSFEEAEKLAGFSITYPDQIAGYEVPVFEAVKDELLQITYESGKDNVIVIRASSSENDDTADYASIYTDNYITSKEDAAVKEECSITYKGDMYDSIHAATWSYKGLSYSITSNAGLPYQDIHEIVTGKMGIEIYGIE